MNWRCWFGHKERIEVKEICYMVVDVITTCERCGYRNIVTVRDAKFYDQMKFERVI